MCIRDRVVGTPTAGKLAFMDAAGDTGKFTSVSTAGKRYIVGRFMSKVDSDGYIKVEVNLPQGSDLTAGGDQV